MFYRCSICSPKLDLFLIPSHTAPISREPVAFLKALLRPSTQEVPGPGHHSDVQQLLVHRPTELQWDSHVPSDLVSFQHKESHFLLEAFQNHLYLLWPWGLPWEPIVSPGMDSSVLQVLPIGQSARLPSTQECEERLAGTRNQSSFCVVYLPS